MDVSTQTHTIFFKLQTGDSLVDALGQKLRECAVATGTLHAHGVLEHVELRTFAPSTKTLGASRAISGAVHALTVDGTIGLSEGSPHTVLRAVLSRETDSGIETLSGVITSARVVAMEVVVTSAQDLALPLVHDGRAGIALVSSSTTSPTSPQHATPTPRPVDTSGGSAWAEAVATSAAQPAIKSPTQNALPARPPARPAVVEENVDQVFPEAGDLVQHFAFGTCEVLRSDGDRLHLKVGKDGRIREIALEMLKVTLLDADASGKPRLFKLDRKL